MQIDSTQALSQFVGSLPTFIAVILAWMNSNGRANDMNARINDLRNDMRAESQTTRELLRAEFRRVEEVMDARIKHLEEREQ